MNTLSLTRLKLRSIFKLFQFIKLSDGCIRQAKADPKCLAGATYMGPGLTFWTATLWENEEAMKQYMRTGAHLKAMPFLVQWCSEATTGRLQTDSPVIPRKEILRSVMVPVLKTFKVQKPSAQHLTGEIHRKGPWNMQVFK